MFALFKNKFIAFFVTPAVLCAIAFAITVRMPGIEKHSFFSLFMGAVAVAAFLGGWPAALVTAGLSLLANAIYLLPPGDSILVSSTEDAVRLVAFAFTSFMICALAAAVKKYERALEGSQATLKSKEDEISFLKHTGSVWSWEYDAATKRVRLSNIFNSHQLVHREQDLAEWMSAIDPADRPSVTAAIERGLVEGEFEARYRMSVDGAAPRTVISRAVSYSVDGKLAGLRGIEMNVEMGLGPMAPAAAR